MPAVIPIVIENTEKAATSVYVWWRVGTDVGLRLLGIPPASEALTTMNMPEKKTAAKRQHRVLIVDDERPIRELLARFLTKRGFDVDIAANGKDALEKLYGDKPHLLLIDIQMPIMDGTELMEWVAHLEIHVPVICAMSGVASDEEVANVLRSGVADFFPKPLNLEELLSCIERRLAEVPN